jgi:ferric iron reductase protein FhuF
MRTEPTGDAVPTDEVRALLADVDALGGFFTISTRPEEAVDPSWSPLTTFTGDPLVRRIDEVDTQLGSPGHRIAASLLAMSVTARFTGLMLAASAAHGTVLRLPHDRLHWRPWSGGPMPLWIAEPGGTPLDGPTGVDDLAAELCTVHLEPLVTAVRERVTVSPRVLWGNAAASWAGALRVLVTERPALHDRAVALAQDVVAREPLAGLGGFVAEPGHPTGIGFARRTCCLFYRVPGGGTCGDCVLNHR